MVVERKLDVAVDDYSADQEVHISDATLYELWKI